MKIAKKERKLELKRLEVSLSQLYKENSKEVKLNECLICKKDPGKNFILKYKRNNELKGKICMSCNSVGQ